MQDQVAVLTDLEHAGVRLRSVMENVDETAAGKLMRNIYGAFKQFDNDRKAERTKLGMQKAASLGRFPFKAPLGYLNVGSRNSANLIPDPARSPIVQKAFELYAVGTQTRGGVLRTVTALGLTTQSGCNLTPQTFERLLRNPIYSGWIVIPTWGLREKGSFEPLVSEDTFHRVQEILDGKRLAVTAHQRNNPDFPLRVFARCGTCGTPLTGSWSKGRKARYAYYRCRSASCRAVNVRRDKLEKDFTALLEELTPDRRYMRLFSEVVRHAWKQKQSTTEAILQNAKADIAALANRKNKLVDFLLAGHLDQQTYAEQVRRLAVETDAAEKNLRAASLDRLDVEAVLAFAEKLIRQPQQLWIESSLDRSKSYKGCSSRTE